MKLGARTLVAVLVAAAVSGCGVRGGETVLKAASPEPRTPVHFDSDDVSNDTFLRLRGFYVCTTGDDEVSITGVSLLDSATAKVTGFRVTRAPQEDLVDGASGLTETSSQPFATDLAESQEFRQTCDTGAGDGSTYLTVDSEFDTLPVESPGLKVTYRVGDETKETTLDVGVVVCDEKSGCPDDPDEDF